MSSGVVPMRRPSRNTRAPVGRDCTETDATPLDTFGRADAGAAGDADPAVRGAGWLAGPSRVSDTASEVIGFAVVIVKRRSSDVKPSRENWNRCGPFARSRTVIGVRPYSRPSTETVAPGGVERTMTLPSTGATIGRSGSRG